MSRIQISREDFVNLLVDIAKPPMSLVKKLDKPPLCHLLSTYVIKPVACDENPFYIHYKNKQQAASSGARKFNNKNKMMIEDPAVVEGDSSSDDEFAKVKTDKKRVRKNLVPYVHPVEPTEVKTLERAPVKAVEEAKAEPVKVAAAQEKVIERAPVVVAAPVKKVVKAPTPAKPKDNEYANAMKAMFGGAPTPVKEEPKPVVVAIEEVKTEAPATRGRGGKKHANEERP